MARSRWEQVGANVWRFRIPGGWLYCHETLDEHDKIEGRVMCFVPWAGAEESAFRQLNEDSDAPEFQETDP